MSKDNKCFVELKNKFNTMNSASAKNTAIKMLNKISKNKNYKCFLVEVIAQKSQNKIWSFKVNGETIQNKRIRKMSIDHFYQYITGDANSFINLINQINEIIKNYILKRIIWVALIQQLIWWVIEKI